MLWGTEKVRKVGVTVSACLPSSWAAATGRFGYVAGLPWAEHSVSIFLCLCLLLFAGYCPLWTVHLVLTV